MKHLIIYSFIVLINQASLFGQVSPAHEWNATIIVVDETGLPVPGANVKVMFSTLTTQNKLVSTNMSGLSDSIGVFHAMHAGTDGPALLFRATKAGFYETAEPYDLGFDYSFGRWNPEIKLLLKKVGNPVSMYAKRIDAHPPATGKPLGFDLEVGDWITPFGKGKVSDIFFQWDNNKRSRFDYDAKLIVSFPNPGDGIQEFSTDTKGGNSELASPTNAPINGYIPRIERVNISHPGEKGIWDYDANRKYFFRVRTSLNEKHDVTGAVYGKIYGDFMHFTYYLNAKPNDPNIEFDPQKNLIPGQKITAP